MDAVPVLRSNLGGSRRMILAAVAAPMDRITNGERGPSSGGGIPAGDPGRKAGWRSSGRILVQAVAAVLLCTLVPMALFMPPWAVVKAFRRHVDVPGCQATCARHALEFESYSSTNAEDLCLCHVAENPQRWQAFKQSYYVLGGDSFGAAVLDAVIRGSAVVGLFLLELVVLLFALFALIRWRRKTIER
jgi:hypothetical protein